jgi:very-short-patch-repair endonuclease
LRRDATQPERTLWSELKQLRELGFHFRRQVPIGPYFVDFICHRSRLALEVDGDLLGSETAQRHDAIRTRFLEAEGYEVVRVSNRDISTNLDGVLELILDKLNAPPAPPHRGEGSEG